MSEEGVDISDFRSISNKAPSDRHSHYIKATTKKKGSSLD